MCIIIYFICQQLIIFPLLHQFLFLQQLFITSFFLMSSKRIHSSCRPQSATTQTTRLTLPSEAVLSATTDSGFRMTEQRNQFGDSMLQEPDKSVKKLGTLNKTTKKLSKEEQIKEKEKEKIEYDRQKSKPLQKSTIVKEEDKKMKKETKSIVAESKIPTATLKLVRTKNQPMKPGATNNIVLPKQTGSQIDYSKWKKNDKLSNSKQSQKKEQTKQEMQEQKNRERNELSRFINEMELKNMELLSDNYETSIESAARRIQNGEIEGLDVWKSSLENEFSDSRFHKLVENIQKNEKQLNNEELEGEKQEIMSQSNIASQQSLMNMTLSDLQQRNNLFLTEINRDKKLKTQSISTLEEIQKSQQKMHKLEAEEDSGDKSEQQDSELQQQSPTTKKSKNPINNTIQRNIISISTQYYQCDYLPQIYKQRLAQLLEQIQTGANHTPNPFQLSEQLELHIRLIDEGIRVYRKEKMEELVIDKNDLPRDAELRKEAELKILKSKLEQVNTKLLSLNKGTVTKGQIDELVKELKENCLIPKSKTVEIKKQKLKQIVEASENTRKFIQTATQNSKQIQSDMQQIKSKFNQLQQQITKLQNLTAEEEHQLRVTGLNNFKTRVQELSQRVEQLPSIAAQLEVHANSMRQNLQRIEAQINIPSTPLIEVPGYKQDENIQDINKVIEYKIRMGKQGIENQKR